MDAPHLTDPESGSSSPIRILNSIVTASSFFPIIAILSSFPTIKLMWSSSFVPSTVLETSVTNNLSFPGSRSALNPTQGYRLLEAGSSSTVILSSSFLLDVACLPVFPRLPVCFKPDPWISSAGSRQLFHCNFIQQFSPGCCLP